VAAADRHWEEALGYFTGGEWERWFKDLYRNDLPARMSAIKGQYGDDDLGLDAFLRSLDPTFPPPRLASPVATLDVGKLAWGETRTLDWEVHNQGSGCLHARVVDFHAGLQVDPLEFHTHDRQVIRVSVNAGLLTPAATVQTLHLDIDAGSGGRFQLAVRVTVPEPELNLAVSSLDLGSIHLGDQTSKQAQVWVRNHGGSPFKGEALSDQRWLVVHPRSFLCPPGGRRKLNLQVDTRDMTLRPYQAQLRVRARAGKWVRDAPVGVHLQVSFWKTLREWLKPLELPALVIAGAGLFGCLWGGLLGVLLDTLGVRVIETSTGILTGAMFGALICGGSGAAVGALGKFRRGGAREIGKIGLVTGVIVGALGGLLVPGFLPDLGPSAFGGLVSGTASAIFGAILWLLPRR
jgi:hypothetical protein